MPQNTRFFVFKAAKLYSLFYKYGNEQGRIPENIFIFLNVQCEYWKNYFYQIFFQKTAVPSPKTAVP